MELVNQMDVDWIVNHNDGTSTIKYTNGKIETVPTPKANDVAKFLGKTLGKMSAELKEKMGDAHVV